MAPLRRYEMTTRLRPRKLQKLRRLAAWLKLRRRRRQPQAQQAGGTAVDTQAVASKSAPILDPGVPLPQDVQEHPKNPINSPRNTDVETGLPDGVCKGETGQCGHGDVGVVDCHIDMKVPSASNRSCSSESESGTPGWLREHRLKKAEGRLRTFAGGKRPLEVARTGQDPQNQNGGTVRPVSGTPPRNKLAREAFGRLRSAGGEYQRVPEHPRARGSSGLRAKSAPSRPTQYASPPLRPRYQDGRSAEPACYILDALNILKHRNAGDSKDGSLCWDHLMSAARFYKQRGQVLLFFPQLARDHSAQIELLRSEFGDECIVTTPSQADDDSFMISYALLMQQQSRKARIVTNDLLRNFVDNGTLKDQDAAELTVKYAIANRQFVPEDLWK